MHGPLRSSPHWRSSFRCCRSLRPVRSAPALSDDLHDAVRHPLSPGRRGASPAPGGPRRSGRVRARSTLGRPSGRVQVILVDQSDLSNGWATTLPFNTIEIAAAAPGASSSIGNTDDWLHLVFAHEYTHIVHLSRGQGWIGGLRRVFGRLPLLYPNLYLPKWQIEGLAVHEESALTGQGRVPDTSFRAIVDVASAASRFEPLDRAGGGPCRLAIRERPYVYGAYFHEFLAARYGEASLRQLTDSTAGRVPYFGSRAFKKVFKRSLGELWREFETASRAEIAPAAPPCRGSPSTGSPPAVRDSEPTAGCTTPSSIPTVFRRSSSAIPAPRRHGRSRTVCLARASGSRDPRSCSIRSRSQTRWGSSRICTRYGATAGLRGD